MSLSSIFNAGLKHEYTPAIASGTTAIALGALFTYKAVTATKVVAGLTAAPGAIKTITLISATGETVVYSLVNATIAHKIALVVVGGIVAGALAYGVYHIVKDLKDI